MSDDREQWLQQRAYAIWETEGCPGGRDREHWEQAVRELSAAQAAEPSTSHASSILEQGGVKEKGRRRSALKAVTSTSSRRKKAPELRP
jgi:hypothetical protein